MRKLMKTEINVWTELFLSSPNENKTYETHRKPIKFSMSELSMFGECHFISGVCYSLVTVFDTFFFSKLVILVVVHLNPCPIHVFCMASGKLRECNIKSCVYRAIARHTFCARACRLAHEPILLW